MAANIEYGRRITDLHTWIDSAVNGASHATYVTSAGLIAGDVMSYLDHHAAAFGVLLGAATFVTNLFFNCIRHKAHMKALAARAQQKGD